MACKRKLLVFFILATTLAEFTSAENVTDECDVETIGKADCGGIGWYLEIFENLEEACSNVECNLQCLSDIVGDCYKRPELHIYDMVTRSAFVRMICKDVAYSTEVFNNCAPNLFSNRECFQMYINYTDSANKFKESGNHTLFKEVLCEFRKFLMVDCFSVFDLRNCTDEHVNFTKTVYSLYIILAECDPNITFGLEEEYLRDISCAPQASDYPEVITSTTLLPTTARKSNEVFINSSALPAATTGTPQNDPGSGTTTDVPNTGTFITGAEITVEIFACVVIQWVFLV